MKRKKDSVLIRSMTYYYCLTQKKRYIYVTYSIVFNIDIFDNEVTRKRYSYMSILTVAHPEITKLTEKRSDAKGKSYLLPKVNPSRN